MVATVSAKDLGISDAEVKLLCAGLLHFGGPANPTGEFAVAMGFRGLQSMHGECAEIRRGLEATGELTPRDWTRALVSLEIAFASDLVGVGYEWTTVTGRLDEETVRDLRSIQRKLVRVVFPVLRSGELIAAHEESE